MKVAIIGAGQLGSSLAKIVAERQLEYTLLTRPELDVTDVATITPVFSDFKPDVVINTAAYHKVDLCEDTPGETFLVNAVGARNVAVACREVSAVPVYISSDYVFDGEKRTPYEEQDHPNPLSVYGTAKLAAENMMRVTLDEYFIVRSTGLYAMGGSSGKGGNFVETMIRLASSGNTLRVVDDQVLTPTYAVDLAERICDLIQTDDYGLYHMTNTGEVSWHSFAAKIFELAGIDADLEPTTTEAYAAKAARPAYSVLDNARMRDAGLSEMRSWDEALADYIARRSAS